MSRAARHPRMRGMSLIELMIALAIGTLLMMGLVQVFTASRTAYQMSSGMARTQENGRFAIDYLQRDLRMIGHSGCVNDQSRFRTTSAVLPLATTFIPDSTTNNYPAVSHYALRFDLAVEGYEAANSNPSSPSRALTTTPVAAGDASAWSPAVNANIWSAISPQRPVAGSDIIVLRFLSPESAQVSDFNPATVPVTLTVNATQLAQLQENGVNPRLLGVADCMSEAVFQANGISGGTISVQAAGGSMNRDTLSGNESFGPGQATVHKAEVVVYYVGINGNGNPALNRLRFVGHSATGALVNAPRAVNEELVEGVESLQLRYGQDSRTASNEAPSGNVGSVATADALAGMTGANASYENAWRRVALVQVGLVMRSSERAATDLRATTLPPLTALGVRYTAPDDKHYRTVYEDSVALRNRLFGKN